MNLKPLAFNPNCKEGFTIIEVLIVITITVMLSAVMLAYSHSSKGLIALFREQAKITSVISQAKSFALQTYIESGSVCGYGVHIDQEKNSFIFFRDTAADCSTSDNVYTPDANPTEEMQTVLISDGVRIQSSDASDILFIPPDPRVVITQGQGQAQEEMNIILETTDGSAQAKINLNSSGQITAR